MRERILVVDDETSMARAMQQTLTRKGFQVDLAGSGVEALDVLRNRTYGALITDLRMPGIGGDELLRRVRTVDPSIQVVVVTAYGTVESAVSCVRDGALDYLMKPFSPEALIKAASLALQSAPGTTDDDETAEFIAEDPAILAALELARKAAACDATVLLEAESGAGKEVFARFIHRESPRSGGPFVAVNCAALPRELLEAELFGHSRGAFTGAHRERKGRFQIAHTGTLLLDEIGEMHTELQARLLRVLQDKIVHPIGSDEPVRTDVRVIAATNCNLRAEVACGRFREDLYYRLRVLPIRIPALRERPGDIEPLARRFARIYGGPGTRISGQALALLKQHSWPGNVREFENAIQRAVILVAGETIEARHFELERAASETIKEDTLPDSLHDAERETIRRVLEQFRGNRTDAAAALGISPRTLRHKLKCYRDEGRPVRESR